MWNTISPGFELVSPCPFPATITITPLAHLWLYDRDFVQLRNCIIDLLIVNPCHGYIFPPSFVLLEGVLYIVGDYRYLYKVDDLFLLFLCGILSILPEIVRDIHGYFVYILCRSSFPQTCYGSTFAENGYFGGRVVSWIRLVFPFVIYSGIFVSSRYLLSCWKIFRRRKWFF